ncbi:MAG: MATE family efflux transporter [Bacteroidales bacterium]
MKNLQIEKTSVPKAVIQMVIPSIITMLGIIVYNMADTFFVGQTGDANQVAAVSLATPVFMLFMAVGNIFGIGSSSLISRLIGQGDT